MNFQFKQQPTWLSYGIIVIILHIIGIALLLINAHKYPQIIGFGFLAYTLGLRHAFDVDHIAAIDNTVRKLVQDKEDPAGVGFFFSIGHSSVVFVMTIITAFSMKWAQNNIPQLKEIGSLIGTTVSGIFLVLIGALNLYIWFDIYKIFIGTRRGEYHEENLDKLLLNRGFISRLLVSFYHFINKSWHVYPLGFLFGLGFDTASEVALFIGFIELAQILTPKLGLNSGFWKWIQNLNFGSMGYLLVGLFIISWGVSYLMWKMLRLENA